MELKKNDITKWIVFLPAFAILLTSLIILSIVITSEIRAYNQAVEEAHVEYVKNAKLEAKDRIDKLIDYINFNEQFVLQEAKEEVRNMVNVAHSLIMDTYKENPKLPKKVLLEIIKSKLRNTRFFNDLSGYYFIHDMQGNCILLDPFPSLEGTNILDAKDGEGGFLVKNFIQKLKDEDSAFYEWTWKNEADKTYRKKTGYLRYIAPLDIFIGSGRYEDEIREKIKKETQKLLINTRYGERGDGYIFAHDYEGVNIAHGNPEEIGRNRYNVVSGGQQIIRDFIEGAKINPEGFFMTYKSTYRPGGSSDTRKIAFIRAVPQFEWAIATGAYVAEEQKALSARNALLKEKMKETIYTILFVSFAIIFIILWVMYILSHKIKTIFTRYENHLLISNQKIKEQKLVFETLYQKSADGVWLLKDGIFVDCNESIVKMFSAQDKSQLINIGPVDIAPEFQPDGQNSHKKSLLIDELSRKKGTHKFEWYAKAIDGRLFWISVVITTIKMKDGLIQHCSVRDITARKELEEENKKQKKLLMHQNEHDVLTGLPNRNLLQDRLAQAIKKASRDNTFLAVVFIDVDKFKSVNDSLGHDMGDMLLCSIAKRLKESIRETDTAARLSGDEFIVLLDGCKDSSDIFIAIKKLIASFNEPFVIGNENFKITLSIGVSVYPHDGVSASKLLKNADIAMYKAKLEGRNRCKFFDQEMNEETNEHLEIEKSLHKALKKNEFVLYYQPQLNLQSEKIVGFEALIRWNHPEKGLVPPAYFIHVAEESELIIEIGSWVTKEAMRQMKEWYDKGLNPGKVAINFAGKQLDSNDLVPFVQQSLEESGCKPEWIEIEIVERFIMKDTTKSIQLLRRLRESGIDISIDDFGTGHSSLAYLKHLPVTKLKIDQSFVQNIETSPQDRAIARTIIELGRGLGLKVLAEGVEDAIQKEFIYSSGCELMQGYFFSKPLCAKDAEIVLKNQNQML